MKNLISPKEADFLKRLNQELKKFFDFIIYMKGINFNKSI